MALNTNGGFDTFLQVGVVIIALVMLGGVGAYSLSQFTTVSDTTVTVANETFDASSDPYTYEVSKTSQDNFTKLYTVTCYESVSQDTTIACDIKDADAGTVEITGQSSTDAGDESIDYDYGEADENVLTITNTGNSSLEQLVSTTEIMVAIALLLLVVVVLKVFRGGRGSAI